MKNPFWLLILGLALSMPFLSCKKKTEVLEESEAEPAEEVLDFYSPEADDASWVDSLLVKIEEERIADELAKMEDSLADYQIEEKTDEKEETAEESSENQQEEINPIEKFFEENRQGRVLNDKNNQMRFFEFDDEIISPQWTDEGLTLVYSNGSNVTRNYYDEKYRLSKKEEWEIRSAADAKKLKTEKFTYSEDSGKVIQKDIITDAELESVFYNNEGSPLTTKKYAIYKDKNHIIMERKWIYDEENRVLKDEQKEYTYKDEKYKKLSSTFTKNYEYSYNAEEIPPDVKYYENGFLKMQNKYTSEKGNYISWVYFDQNLSVKTYYENDIRSRDEYYNKGQLFRIKEYDKPSGENDERKSN